MEKMFIFLKNRLIYFLLLWILSIRSVTTSCDMRIPHGDVTWWCKTVGQPCSYSCDEGYKEHDIVSWLMCSTSGQWVPWLPYHFYGTNFSADDLCTPKPCPTAISKGTLSEGCKAVVGSICNFSCEVGYVRNTSASELTCQTSTEWSPDLRSLCLRPDGQQCPYVVPRGYLNLRCIREPGHTCNFACNEGYQPSLSPSIIACGSNLEWNYELGSLCKEIICPNLIEGGYIGNNCTKEYKSKCYEYECNPGYAKPDPASYVTCDESGKWVGPDGKSQACARDQLCPEKFHGGYINWNCNRIPQESCTYDCYQGCLKNRSITWLTCQENRLWDVDTTSLCIESDDTIYSLKATTSAVPRNELSIVGIAVGCIIGTILITVSVGLIIQGLRTSRRRRLFRHVSSRCLGPTGYSEWYVTSVVQNHNTNNTGVAAPNEPYEHSFDSRTDIIANRYSRPPPSYTQTQVTSKEYPPTYEQVVANPSGFNLYI